MVLNGMLFSIVYVLGRLLIARYNKYGNRQSVHGAFLDKKLLKPNNKQYVRIAMKRMGQI